MTYTTDLSASQFEILDQYLPKSKTKKHVVSRHAIVNAIMYQLKNGCQWRDGSAIFVMAIMGSKRDWRKL